MENLALVLLSALVLGLGAAVAALLLRSRSDGSVQARMDALASEVGRSLSETTRHINSQLSAVTGQVAEQLSSVSAQVSASSGQVSARMDSANRAVGEVRQALGELSKATEQVFEVGKSISGLERILAAPKARGGLGELLLSDLLSECLPAARYELQYGFSDGARVDAAIRLREGIVPVDAKFPLDNFRRLAEASTEDERKGARKKFSADCRKHADAIASSYIRPAEGTLDFALMYLPAESVYYELVTASGDDGLALTSYALSRKVVPVSPNSFYAYLQTIVMGLKGMEIEQRAGEILAHLSSLRSEFDRFSSDLDTLGRHLSFARSKYEEVDRKARQLGGRLDLAASSAGGQEAPCPEEPA